MYDSGLIWDDPCEDIWSENRTTTSKYDAWLSLESRMASAESRLQSLYEKYLRPTRKTTFSPKSYVIPKHDYEIALDEDGIEELMTLIGGHYENNSNN